MTCIHPRAHLPVLLIGAFVILPGATEVISPSREAQNSPILKGETRQRTQARLVENREGRFFSIIMLPKSDTFSTKILRSPDDKKWKWLATGRLEVIVLTSPPN